MPAYDVRVPIVVTLELADGPAIQDCPCIHRNLGLDEKTNRRFLYSDLEMAMRDLTEYLKSSDTPVGITGYITDAFTGMRVQTAWATPNGIQFRRA